MNTQTQNQTTNGRRRTGTIARLPKVLRDKINTMLDDGYEYAEIISDLEDSQDPALPWAISEDSLGRWKNTGYQDHLRDQSWRERIDAKADRYLEVGLSDGTKLAAGGLYAAAIQICELMDEIAAASEDETDVDKCSRATNAFSRLSRSILMLQQYRDQLAKEKAAEQKLRDPKKPFGDDNDHRAVVDIVDKVLGLGRYTKPRKPKTEPAPAIQNSGDGAASSTSTSASVTFSERPCESVPAPTASNTQHSTLI